MAFFTTLLLYAALFVLSDLLAPKPDIENAKPLGIDEFNFPTATEGRAIPIVWGTVQLSGPNVVWYGDLVQQPITEEIKTGLFSSENVIKGYRYFLGTQEALCYSPVGAPVQDFTRIWIGDELLADYTSSPVTHDTTFTIDEPEFFGGDELGQGGFEGTFRFFAGTTTQAVSTYLSEFQQEGGDTPAYRSICYVAPDTDPPYLGNQTSIKPRKYEVRRFPNQLGLTSNREIVNGGDANPAAALYEILTDDELGVGLAAADVDATSFQTAGNTLFDEGNGFSYIAARQGDVAEVIRIIEEQIDGIVYLDQATGKWTLTLVRADYSIGSAVEVDEDVAIDERGLSRGTWEGTKNQVRVPFTDREDDYKSTYAFEQDIANRLIVGKTTSTEVRFPGVKYGPLAAKLALRELRTQATPLLAGDLVCTRAVYGVKPGDVVAYTSTELGYTQLPMRVKSVDYGDLVNGRITLSVVQDIFQAETATNAPPGDTGWTPPSDTLVAFPADEQVAFEAPRAFTLRDPGSPSPATDKIWASARRQGPEAIFRIKERNAAGTPSGAYEEIGSVFAFNRIGQLNAALDAGSAYPLASLNLTATPDSQSALEAAFADTTNVVELGTELVNLVLVGSEFMLVESAQASGPLVQLNNVYRGALDSVQADHALGADVYVLSVGGGISSGTVPAGNNVDVKLIPKSILAELVDSAATEISFQMQNRTRRPYPPSEMSLNGTRFDTTVSLEGGTGTGEDIGIDLEFIRRSFLTVDEVEALSTDAATLDASYPSEYSTTHKVEVINDPDGSATSLFTQNIGSVASDAVRRLDILEATDGALPTRLRFRLTSTHTFEGTSYDSFYDLDWDFDLSSGLTGQFEFGALDTNDVSASYTVDADTNDHDFEISSAFTLGDVEYRLNGGSWTTLIAGGNTTGSIAAGLLTNGDTIEVRHTSTDSSAQKLITMSDGSAAAFGVLFT